MANTVIQLKKSSTPSSIPTSLAEGELALNYADGILYYKAANGAILSIAGSGGVGQSYGIVNADGTLLVAGFSGDTFSITPGDFITITGDAINDKITVAANVKVIYDVANAAFNYANGLAVGSAVDALDAANQAGVIANAAFDKANSANVLAFNTGIGANTYAGVMSNSANAYANSLLVTARAYTNTSVTAANNYAGTMANSANAIASATYATKLALSTGLTSANNYAGAMANAANAFASSFTLNLSPAFSQANSAYLVANAAFDKANSISFSAAGNTFTSVSVPGQNTITAGANDTLNLAAGENINITTNSVSKTITISTQNIGANVDYGWINLAFLTTTQNYGSI